MRVALNCAILRRGFSGTASVTRLLATILRDTPGIELFEVAPRAPLSVHRWANAARDVRWDLWGAGHKVKGIDVLVSPCNIGRAPQGVGHVLVVHDTMVLDHPHLFDRGYARYARALFGPSIASATLVIVPSQHTASSIRRRWPKAPPIQVLGYPSPPLMRSSPRSLPPPPWTVLMVGATEPHKNHVAGIEAVRLARLLTGAPLHIELIGPEGLAEGDVSATLAVVDPAGTWSTRRPSVSGPELEAAYARAWALLQPSVDEGFCLPLVEAGSHGLPVVHSGAGSMAEVAPHGNTGGHDPVALARALRRLADPGPYQEASRASLDASRQRPVGRFADSLVEAIREAAP